MISCFPIGSLNTFADPATLAAPQHQQLGTMSSSSMPMMNPYQPYPMRASPTQHQQQQLQNLLMTHGQVVQPPMQSIMAQPQQQFMMPPPPPPPPQQQQQQFGSSPLSGTGTTEASPETMFAPLSFVGTGGGSSSAAGGDATAASREALLSAMQQQTQQQQQQQQLGRSSAQQQQDLTSQQQQQPSNSSSTYSDMLQFGYGGGPTQQQRRGSLGDSSYTNLGFGVSTSSVAGGAMDPSQSQLGMFGAGASFVQNDPQQQASRLSLQQYQDQFRRQQQQHFQQIERQQNQQQQQPLSGSGQMIDNSSFFNQSQQQQQYDTSQQHIFQQMLQIPTLAKRRRSSLDSTSSDMSPLNPALHGPSQFLTSTTAGTGTGAASTATTAAPAAGGGFASLDSGYPPMQQQPLGPTNEYYPNFPQANEPSIFSSFLGVGRHPGLMPSAGGVAAAGGDTMFYQLPEHLRSPPSSTETSRGGKRKARTFPEKLMEAMMMYGEEDMVAWLPDGKSFVVVKPDDFVARVLNPVFKEAKYSSFVRKLHRWGFVRLTSGTGTDCFHHPFFNRNRRELASKITVAAATMARQTASAPSKSSGKNTPSLAGVGRFAHIKAAAFAHRAVKGKVNEMEQEEKMGRESGSGVDRKPAPESSLGGGAMDPTAAKSTKGSSSKPSGIGISTMASSRGPSDAAATSSEKQSQFEQADDRGSKSSKGASSTFKSERAEI